MRKLLLPVCIALLILTSCEKETAELKTAAIEDYVPLEPGKFIVYDLDSILFTDFGQVRSTVSYEVKDEVDAVVPDNRGRESYRIIRYIRKNENAQWQPDNTFTAVLEANTLEWVENNMRFIKLVLPIRDGYSWNGNRYIDTYSLNHDLRYLDGWEYTYDSVNMPAQVKNLYFENTITVKERDEFVGQDPSIPGTSYAEKNYSVARYAWGVGLIYREFIHWEYQGAQPGRPAYYTGYGIVQRIKDHN